MTSATMIGVLMSATLPARLGEPARAMILARRIGRMRETFPVLLGTLVSQTLLNIVALALLGVDHRLAAPTSSTPAPRSSSSSASCRSPCCVVVLVGPPLMRRNGNGRLARIGAAHARARCCRCAPGWRCSASRAAAPSPPPRSSAPGRSSSPPAGRCWRRSGSAAMPASAPPPRCCSRSTSPPSCPRRPSNIGVFQLAVISVLHTGFGISTADALAYGVILQAVEIATAVALGLPALVREGLTWSDLRDAALSAAPVRLEPHPSSSARCTNASAPAPGLRPYSSELRGTLPPSAPGSSAGPRGEAMPSTRIALRPRPSFSRPSVAETSWPQSSRTRSSR